jgi:hypothetical protein
MHTTATDDASALYRHVKIRAWERYKLALTNDDCRDLCVQYRSKKTLFVGRGVNDGTEIHVAKSHGQMVRAVYAVDTGYIVTLLPWGMFKVPGTKIKAPKMRKGSKNKQRRPEIDDEY